MEHLKYGFKYDFESVIRKYPPTDDMVNTLVICTYGTSIISHNIESYEINVNRQVETITPYVNDVFEKFIFDRARRALEPFELYQPLYERIYTMSALVFLRVEHGEYKYINILKCTELEFIEFFKTTHESYIELFNEVQDVYSQTNSITTSIPREFIELAQNMGIRKVNILDIQLDDSPNESNGLTQMDNNLIQHCNVPFIPSTRLAIGMFVHGGFVVNGDTLQEIHVPHGVNITKRNSGAMGCYSISRTYTGWNAFNHTTKILKTFDNCSRERYVEFISSHPPELNHAEGSCTMFQGKTKYYLKEYEFDDTFNQLMFVLINPDNTFRYINIATCTLEALLEFLKCRASRQIRHYISERDEKKIIDTRFIFFLIETLHETSNITDVHIYDKSCNLIPSLDEKNYNGYSTTPEKYYKNPDVGWGGTRRKRRRRKTRKI
jgi:hypothetical protein